MFLQSFGLSIAIKHRLGHCDGINRIFKFFEACNGCCFCFFSSFVKALLLKTFFSSYFETQAAYVF